MKPVAYSYSRISSYEQCPRKFWEESVAKNYPFVKNEAAIYGEEVHKAFELFIKNGKKLPLHLSNWTDTLTKIASAPGEKIVEQQIALDAGYELVEWFAKDAYIRVKSDLTQLNGARAIIWDYKTGKQSDDFTQLKLNAAVTFHLDPQLERVDMAYLWLKTKQITTDHMLADDVPNFWSEFLPRVQRYQDAHVKQDWPARPNFLCKGWCPVSNCPYWEKKR